MNNLTKIAALPTGGGCQSALRPEDRGVERKPASGRFRTITAIAHPSDQVEWLSVEPCAGRFIQSPRTLTINFGGKPIDVNLADLVAKAMINRLLKGGAA